MNKRLFSKRLNSLVLKPYIVSASMAFLVACVPGSRISLEKPVDHDTLSETQRKLEETEKQLNESQEKLGKTKDKLSAARKNLEDKEEKLGKSKHNLGEMSRELTKLRAQSRELTRLNSVKRGYKQVLRQISEHHQNLQISYQDLQAQHLTREEKLKAEIDTLKTKMKKTQAALKDYRKKYIQTRNQVTEVSGHRRRAENQLEQSQIEHKQTRIELQQTQEDLSQSRADHAWTRAELEESRSVHGQTQEKLEKLEDDFSRAQESLEELRALYLQAQEDLKNSQGALEDSQARHSQTQENLSEVQGHLERETRWAQNELAQLTAELKKSEAELTDLEGKFANALNDLEDLFNLYDDLKNRHENLQAEHEQAKAAHAAREADLEDQIRAAENEVQFLRLTLEHTNANLSVAQAAFNPEGLADFVLFPSDTHPNLRADALAYMRNGIKAFDSLGRASIARSVGSFSPSEMSELLFQNSKASITTWDDFIREMKRDLIQLHSALPRHHEEFIFEFAKQSGLKDSVKRDLYNYLNKSLENKLSALKAIHFLPASSNSGNAKKQDLVATAHEILQDFGCLEGQMMKTGSPELILTRKNNEELKNLRILYKK